MRASHKLDSTTFITTNFYSYLSLNIIAEWINTSTQLFFVEVRGSVRLIVDSRQLS